jgi:hypothetical protein
MPIMWLDRQVGSTGMTPTTNPGTGATLLHEQTGLRIVRNAKNRFCVATLHYTADPIKRDPNWITEARQGMTASQWAKEMEIDYTALYGERVFPEITSNRERIVVPGTMEFDKTRGVYWGGFDYGSRNPSSFHVYTYLDGVYYAIWELYEPCKNLTDFCTKWKACPYWSVLKYIVADPMVVNTKNTRNRFGNVVTLNELLIEQGIRNLRAGLATPEAEAVWLSTIRDHWRNPEEPTFKILDTCPNMIREFETSVFSKQNALETLTETYRENMADVNNHALDDCKYALNGKPGLVQRTYKQLDTWKRWIK